MIDLFQYQRRATNTVTIGSLLMGSSQPIRIQSMATTNTNDTEASVAQAMRIIEAGGELVRFTTQGTREAENMKNINAGIRALGKILRWWLMSTSMPMWLTWQQNIARR